MSRSYNQKRCGRGCSVCGIGELENERYRLARESELDTAALDEIIHQDTTHAAKFNKRQ